MQFRVILLQSTDEETIIVSNGLSKLCRGQYFEKVHKIEGTIEIQYSIMFTSLNIFYWYT